MIFKNCDNDLFETQCATPTILYFDVHHFTFDKGLSLSIKTTFWSDLNCLVPKVLLYCYNRFYCIGKLKVDMLTS